METVLKFRLFFEAHHTICFLRLVIYHFDYILEPVNPAPYVRTSKFFLSS